MHTPAAVAPNERCLEAAEDTRDQRLRGRQRRPLSTAAGQADGRRDRMQKEARELIRHL